MNFIYEMPAPMLLETDKKGTVERFIYNTQTYDEQESLPMKKGAWVYLPYGYDNTKPYNILYLLHGVAHQNGTVGVVAQGICEPCIIVTPTYYRGTDIDRNGEFITEHFRHELRKDLIPAIESKYSTYAKGDVSEENLINTRSHRAFSGLSLGSMTTYRAAFYNNYDLFSWYGPFSGCCGPKGDRSLEVKRITETLENGVKNNLPLSYMFCCNGDQDIAYEEHKEIMENVTKTCDILKQGENYDFFIIPGGVHDMKAWQLHLYHALQIFFTK